MAGELLFGFWDLQCLLHRLFGLDLIYEHLDHGYDHFFSLDLKVLKLLLLLLCMDLEKTLSIIACTLVVQES